MVELSKLSEARVKERGEKVKYFNGYESSGRTTDRREAQGKGVWVIRPSKMCYDAVDD